MSIELIQVGIFLGVGVLITSVVMGLAGLINRRRYRPLGLYLWPFLLLIIIWLLLAAPFFLFEVILRSGRVDLGEFFVPVLSVAMFHFAVLLPFLVLSSVSPFYRERLKALLHVKPEMPPASNEPPSGVAS